LSAFTNFISLMRNRLKAVIMNKGDTISY